MPIPEVTKEIFAKYNSIRGKEPDEFPFPYWDLVVLTASDESQKKGYEQQIENKLSKGELPRGIPYIVFADPPGPKVGCGGSTMHAIWELYSKYKEDLWQKKVLLINAGGQSQRLPSASVLGKIFTPLPCGDPMFQLLDLKLASYIPFIAKMSPGIFHAAADTIELFDHSSSDHWTFEEPGFTALAHPSSLEIGATHGVYVLDQEQQRDGIAYMANCLEVLQKPSINRMHDKGAVLTKEDGSKYVYTDSCFFFDHAISKKFLDFYRKQKPFTCEIDAYGDFLQALGPRASHEYVNDTKNVSNIEPSLVETRRNIYNLLKGTRLNVLALEVSKFYHLGTTIEYIQNFCCDTVLAEEIGFKRQVFVGFDTENSVAVSEKSKRQKLDDTMKGVLMHSVLHPDSHIAESAILEYCHFEVPVNVKSNTLLSNCMFAPSGVDRASVYFVDLPPNLFMHTLCISSGNSEEWVTVLFGIQDKIKKSVTRDNLKELNWVGKPLDKLLNLFNCDAEVAFENPEKCSLWSAMLFPVCSSPTESFSCALEMLKMASDELPFSKQNGFSGRRVSLQESVMKYKNTHAVLGYRNTLYKKIDDCL